MRILFFSHQSEFIYGGEVCTLELMQALKDLGVEVFFAAPPGPYLERAQNIATSFSISSVQFRRNFPSLPKFLHAFRETRDELREIVEEEKIDIIHATSLKAAVYLVHFTMLPIIWHHHDILPNTFQNQLWLKFIAKTPCHIFTPSHAARQALLEAGIESEKISTLYNGFSLSKWKVKEPILGKKMRLLTIGEISFRKGSDWIKSIAEFLLSLGVDFEWKIVGSGLSEPGFAHEVEKSCTALVAQRRLHFLGRQERVAEFLQEADFLIVPSRQDPLPTVIIEAFLSGVPAIGTAAGGIPEMIHDGENGFIAFNPREFADKLRAVKDEKYRELSVAARATAEKLFSSQKMAKETLRVYKKIV